LLQHRMNRRLEVNSAVNPTPLLELHSTAPSGCSSAPDDPTRRRCIALVHWLVHVVQRLYWILWVTGWSDACARGTIGSFDGTTFSGNLFQWLAFLVRPINMTPYLSWAAFAIMKIYCS
jgi:hypothetical protein